MYDKTDFDAVIKTASLVKEIEQRIGKLKHIGQNLSANCPFHTEKTASFTVSDRKGIYKCFGCGENGDVISFVAKYDNISQSDAMRKLANEYGVKVSERKEENIEHLQQMYTALKIAAIKFSSELLHNKAIKRYIVERGIKNADILKTWNIGYAPDKYDLVADKEALKSVGLTGQHGNIFRDRITFPIEDVAGRIIGFTARSLTNTKQKYLNTQETEIFHKGTVLYGMRQAISSIKIHKTAIIVEGTFDVINMHNIGMPMTVGTLGTSFTFEHAQIIARYADSCVLVFDGDNAGKKATERAIKNLLAAGIKNIEVSVLAPGIDPAMFKTDEDVPDSISVIEYLYETREGDIEQKIRDVLSIIAESKSMLKRDLLIRELAEQSGVSQYALIDELNSILSKKI
jgi:DNA primase